MSTARMRLVGYTRAGVVEGLTIAEANRRLRRGPVELVPGVCREEGRALLRRMGKQAGAPPDLRT